MTGSTPINWTAFARKHNVPGRNCGQVVKEYLAKQGDDVLNLEHLTTARVRPRWQLLKSFGVVHPAHKKQDQIKEDIIAAITEVATI